MGRETGQAMVEYVILIALITLVALVSIKDLGLSVKDRSLVVGDNLRDDSNFEFGGGDPDLGGDDSPEYTGTGEGNDGKVRLRKVDYLEFTTVDYEGRECNALKYVGDEGVKEVNIPSRYVIAHDLDMWSRDVYVEDPSGSLEVDAEDVKFTELESLYKFAYVPAGGSRYRLGNGVKVTLPKDNQVKDMKSVFSGNRDLEYLDLSEFYTGEAETMSDMFSSCSGLKELDLSNFNTSKVESMGGTFRGCRSLTNIDISTFDTRNVKSMIAMFEGCRSLKELDLPNFTGENLELMHHMFNGCSGLGVLNLENLRTDKVTGMIGTFNTTKSMQYMNLGSLSSKSLVEARSCFNSCGREVVGGMEFILGEDFQNTGRVSFYQMLTHSNNTIKQELKSRGFTE